MTDASTIAHHVNVAFERKSQAVFVLRRDGRSQGKTLVVTYSRAKKASGPAQFDLTKENHISLLKEADAICGGERIDGVFVPDWLPEGVRSVSINWIAPVKNDLSDTFRLTIDTGTDLDHPVL